MRKGSTWPRTPTPGSSSGRAARLYIAMDADPRLLQPLVQEAVRQRVPLIQVDTMRQLGEACGISVGAAIVAAV